MKVKDCLQDKPLTVHRGTPLRVIIEMFKKHRFHVLPVLDSEEHLAGIITLDEITTVFQPEPGHISDLLKTVPFLDTLPEPDMDMEYISPEMGILVVADEIMTTDYFTVSEEENLAKAYTFMKAHDSKVLLAVNREKKLSGIIGLFDIIYTIFREKGIVK